MLPGAGDCAQDLIEHGFVQALRVRQLPVDAAVVDVHMDDYLERSVVRQLADEIIKPACQAGRIESG
jgi:hypothetical protein